jgi:hypothetical protein
MQRNPTLAEVVNEAIDGALDGIYVSLPGRVVRYDASTQQADVQPIPKVRHTDETGAAVVGPLPVVPSVPVQFPGGGGFSCTFPIEVGDTVLLVFSGASMDKWLAGSSADTPLDPETHARHALADAVAIPGVRSFRRARPAGAMPSDHVRLGTEAGTAQGVALSTPLATYLGQIHTWAGLVQTALNSAGFPVSPPLASPPTVASATVKVTE